VELAPDCQINEVQDWLDAGSTSQLAFFLRKRHEARFFGPIECLRKAGDTYSGYGFSMMSLCCLLTETIQCYREGMPTTSKREWAELVEIQGKESVPLDYQLQPLIPKNGREVFIQFFSDSQSFFPNLDGSDFYHYIRNGLLHQAQTKKGWTIDATGTLVCDPPLKHINRNLFAYALHNCFDHYIRILEAKHWDDPEWKRAAKKVWWLIRISK
jgi:hypothetical protein